MPRVPDLIGKRSGYLVVLSRTVNDAKNGTQWCCQCDCGNQTIVRGQYLVASKRGYQQKHCSKFCALYLKEVRLDITGQQFGRLKALQCVGSNSNGEALWQFECSCDGRLVVRSSTNVRRSHTQSCGCITKDKHGRSETPEYRTERTRRWRERHPEKAHAFSGRSQQSRSLRAPKWLTTEQKQQMSELYQLANRLTKETGIPHEVDHIYPLQGELCSGLHVPWNMQVITCRSNRLKSNRHPNPEDIVQPEW